MNRRDAGLALEILLDSRLSSKRLLEETRIFLTWGPHGRIDVCVSFRAETVSRACRQSLVQAVVSAVSAVWHRSQILTRSTLSRSHALHHCVKIQRWTLFRDPSAVCVGDVALPEEQLLDVRVRRQSVRQQVAVLKALRRLGFSEKGGGSNDTNSRRESSLSLSLAVACAENEGAALEAFILKSALAERSTDVVVGSFAAILAMTSLGDGAPKRTILRRGCYLRVARLERFLDRDGGNSFLHVSEPSSSYSLSRALSRTIGEHHREGTHGRWAVVGDREQHLTST